MAFKVYNPLVLRKQPGNNKYSCKVLVRKYVVIRDNYDIQR